MSKMFVVIAAVVAVAAVGAAGVGWQVLSPKSTENGLPVKVTSAKKENIISNITATGIVREGEQANLFTGMSLKVKKINVKIGDKVEKGQALAIFDTDAVKMQINEARINHNMEKANLNNLMGSLKRTSDEKAKDFVAISDAITAQTNITTTKTEVEKKQLAYDHVLEEYEKNKKLYDNGTIPQSDLETAKKNLEVASLDLQGAKKNYENAQNDYSKIVDGQQEQVEKQIFEIQQQIDVQNYKVALAELKIDELSNSLKDVNLDSGKLTAAIGGYIGAVGITEGGFSDKENPAICIVNLDHLLINASVLENDVKDVKIGNKVSISGDSIGNEKYEGVVQNISAVAKKQTINGLEQTVLDVEILVTSKQTVLKPGFNVDLKIESGNMKDVLAIPIDAVKEDKDNNRFVYIIDQGKAKKVNLNVVIKSDVNFGIKENEGGIAENTKIIYSSTGSISDGVPVSVIQEK